MSIPEWMVDQMPEAYRPRQIITKAVEPVGAIAGRIIAAGKPLPADDELDWAELDGAELLDAYSKYNNYFCRYQNIAQSDAVVGFGATSFLRDASRRMACPVHPRLMVLSNEENSGKTTVLHVLRLTACMTGEKLHVEPTAAAVRSMVGPEMLTTLLDEGDLLVGSGMRKEELRAILNASYEEGGCVDVMSRNGTRQEFPVYSPVAMAGLDVLETQTKGLLRTLLSRSIIIRMKRSTEQVPDILYSPEAKIIGEQLRVLLEMWVGLHRDNILNRLVTVTPPRGVKNRAWQIWRPFLALGEEAGGHWPERMRASCRALAGATPDPTEAPSRMNNLKNAMGALA